MLKSFKKIYVPAIQTAIFLLLFVSGTAFAAGYSRIVAFGDSLSDHGGLLKYQAYLGGAYDPVTNPNGVLTTWSNGDVWLDYLKSGLGVELENKAIAGAMSEGHENSSVQSMIDQGILPDLGLGGQIDSYIASGPSFDPATTLFSIWIGGNDLLEFGRMESKYASPDAMIFGATTAIVQDIEKLYSEGARNFLILNLPDVGKAPVYSKMTAEYKAAATQLCFMYNLMLWSGVDKFVAAHSDVKVIKFDAFTYINDQLKSGNFANTTGTYVKLDEKGERTTEFNGPASDYFFWDSIHPTTKAHEVLAGGVSSKIKEATQTPDNGGGTNGGNTGSGSGSSSCFIRTASDSIPDYAQGSAAVVVCLGFAFLILYSKFRD